LTNDENETGKKKKKGKAIVTGGHSYHKRWENPASYEGSNLRVPYRFQSGGFTDTEKKTIRDSMTGMSELMHMCIDFYDDTETACKFKINLKFLNVVYSEGIFQFSA
jgi:hypothetical protein